VPERAAESFPPNYDALPGTEWNYGCYHQSLPKPSTLEILLSLLTGKDPIAASLEFWKKTRQTGQNVKVCCPYQMVLKNLK
jgi:hypothetical protein